MKFLISIFAFLLVLTLGAGATASESAKESHEGSEHEGFVIFPHPEANPEASLMPGKATLVKPEYYAKVSGDSVKLEWKESEGAEHYHLQVATDPAYKWLVVNEYVVKATSYDLKGLQPGNHYFWRVVGVRPNNKAGHTKGFWAASMFETAVK